MEKEFWDQRWIDQQTGWDIGYISTPLKAYFDGLSDKNIKILIPGCGNSYEAEYLNNNSFKNVFIIDISEHAINSFKARCPEFPREHILCGDFFDLDDEFDLIIEQTFFCAINPEMRDRYVAKMRDLLKPGGKLVGVMFDFPLESGPPFGGCKEEYEERFSKHFSHISIKRAENSIEPRQGREFWVEFS
ncbi:MAG: methyltransferase domain-containing protein [Crocinitomicaceae bacterium]